MLFITENIGLGLGVGIGVAFGGGSDGFGVGEGPGVNVAVGVTSGVGSDSVVVAPGFAGDIVGVDPTVTCWLGSVRLRVRINAMTMPETPSTITIASSHGSTCDRVRSESTLGDA